MPFIAPKPDGPVRPGPVPSFSVIVAAYQAAAFVAEAVASALEQTQPPLEVVVCDDGSTDDIMGALEPFSGRIELLRRPHGGEGAAKDGAARAASGDFVVVLDADDIWLPGRLEALGRLAAARPDLDLLTTDAYLEVDGRVLARCYRDDWTFETGDQRLALLHRNFIFGHAAVRRERLLAAGGFDPEVRTVADYDCWLRLVLGGARVGLVAEPLARYRLRPEGLSSSRAAHLRGYVHALERAVALPGLTNEEARVAAEVLAERRRGLLLADAHEAVVTRRSDARSRSFAVARGDSFSRATRLKALASAAMPRLAGFLLARRDRDVWTAAGGLRIPRD